MSALSSPLSHGVPTALSAPGFATRSADRAVQTCLVDDTPQVVAREPQRGTHRVVTRHPLGVDLSEIEPDGAFLWWFDTERDGSGSWRRQGFAADGGAPALTGVPVGSPLGLCFDAVGGLAAVGVGVDGESRCFLGRPGGAGREIHRTRGYRHVVDLSPDGSLLALAGAPDGPHAVVLCETSTGSTRTIGGDPGRRLWALEFDPAATAGPELLLMVERDAGFVMATWSASTGLVVHERLDFLTTASAGWYPGPGRRVLVQQEYAGRSRLLLADLAHPGRPPREVPVPAGTVHDLSCAPDGSIHYLWSRADTAPELRVAEPVDRPDRLTGTRPQSPVSQSSTSRRPVPAPPSSLRELWTPTHYGEIHSLLTTPPAAGPPPWPTVFLVHGGPATHDRDCADPRVDALARAGFAVVRTNYRGSTGYGSRWQHDFGHRVGPAQLEDLAAVRADLVDHGLAAPGRTALYGYSWGGYLTLLALGVQPRLWAAGVAVSPIADYVEAFATTTPALREMDVSLFGGTPEQVPERYATASPITYADRVRAPLLVVAGTHDDRCPPRQIRGYLDLLRARGAPCRALWRDTGHWVHDLDEQASITEAAIDHLRRALNGPPELPDGFPSGRRPARPPADPKGGAT